MATRFDRIQVTKDPALSEALDRARPLIAADGRTARHELAIKGADAAVQERCSRAEQLAWAAQVTTAPRTPWDREILERIDELAWGVRRPRRSP